MGGKSAVGLQLGTFRETRRDIEASVLPLATSVDGRRFTFQASLHGLELQAGGYAVLDDGGTRRLGQVLSVELHLQLAGELTLPSAGGPCTTPEQTVVRATQAPALLRIAPARRGRRASSRSPAQGEGASSPAAAASSVTSTVA